MNIRKYGISNKRANNIYNINIVLRKNVEKAPRQTHTIIINFKKYIFLCFSLGGYRTKSRKSCAGPQKNPAVRRLWSITKNVVQNFVLNIVNSVYTGFIKFLICVYTIYILYTNNIYIYPPI